MEAIKGIRQGKGLSDRISLESDYGRSFEIAQILKDACNLDGDFAGDHVDEVKAAFVRLNLPYPGDGIVKCVVALQAALSATPTPRP